MRTPLIALVAFCLGVAAGFGISTARQQSESQRLGLWRVEMDAVNRWFEDTPGFAEHKAALQPRLDAVQYAASESIGRPPTDDRSRQAYRSVVVLFLAQDHLDKLEPGPANVVERALQRIGLNSYWTDPDSQPSGKPPEGGQGSPDGG